MRPAGVSQDDLPEPVPDDWTPFPYTSEDETSADVADIASDSDTVELVRTTKVNFHNIDDSNDSRRRQGSSLESTPGVITPIKRSFEAQNGANVWELPFYDDGICSVWSYPVVEKSGAANVFIGPPNVGPPNCVRCRTKRLNTSDISQRYLKCHRNAGRNGGDRSAVSLPRILTEYAHCFFSVCLVGAASYAVISFSVTFTNDVSAKLTKVTQEVALEAATCEREYRRNKCDARVPALEEICRRWETCANYHGITQGAALSAETLGRAVSAFFDQLSLKSVALLLLITVLITGLCLNVRKKNY